MRPRTLGIATAHSRHRDCALSASRPHTLDNDRDAWLHGIKALKMQWLQLSDLKGWDCTAAALYAIKSIPANLLIAQDGTIVAKNLREEELHSKLAELLD